MEPSVEEVREILEKIKTIASVGLSSNPEKESYQIVSYLKDQGYTIIPVNPTATEIMGQKVYPSISDLPEVPDVVQIFRRPEDAPPVVDEALRKGVKIIWFQEGTTNPDAAQKAREAGAQVIEDLCMRAAHKFIFNKS